MGRELMDDQQDQIEEQTEQTAPKPGPSKRKADAEDAGLGALQALADERSARKELERRAKELSRELDELRAKLLDQEELASKAATAEASERVWKIAAQYGIPPEDASMFLAGQPNEEALIAAAERYQALTPKTPVGNYLPDVGHRPPEPPSLAEQISAAEQAGDHHLAMQLKTQQLLTGQPQ